MQKFNPDLVNPCRDYFYVVADTSYAEVNALPLREEEEVRAARFQNAADSTSYRLVHGLLNRYLNRFCNRETTAFPLRREEFGKPCLPDSPFHFSISRSGTFVLLAFGPDPIGADVERIRPFNAFLPVVNEHFHPSEKAELEAHPAPEVFFKTWTRKEALVKAAGTGLTDHLDQINTLSDEVLYRNENYRIQSINRDGLMISLAGQKLGHVTGFEA